MNELYHHGIKGQKWGVRRFQNKDGSSIKSGKRNNLIKDGDGFVLKKGSIVQRISDNEEKKSRSYMYVSFTKHDNDFYDKNFTENLSTFSDVNKMYKNTYKIKKDLKIPSSDVSKKLFLQMYKDNAEELIQAMGTARRIADINYSPLTYKFSARNYNGDAKLAYQEAAKYYLNRYSKMTVKQLMDDAYYDFINSLAVNSNTREKFFKKVMDSGYDAILDENDSAGLGSRGYKKGEAPTSPLIILNVETNTEKLKSTVIK